MRFDRHSLRHSVRVALLAVTAVIVCVLAAPEQTFSQCTDCDGDGQEWPLDCNDTRPDVYAGAPQVCDGINNDCWHYAWPDLSDTNEADDDGDGLAECGGDCNDTVTGVHPSSLEICDGIDNNCDGLIDEGLTCPDFCDQADIVLPLAVSPHTDPGASSAAWNGSQLAVAWTVPVNDRVWLWLLDGNFQTVVGPFSLPGGNEPQDVSVTWTGSDWALIWSSTLGILNRKVHFARMSSGGIQQGDTVDLFDCTFCNPTVAWNGSGWGVLYHDQNDLYIRNVGLDGPTVSAPVLVSAMGLGYRVEYDLEWTGTSYGIIHESTGGSGDDELHFFAVSGDLSSVGPDINVTNSPEKDGNPSLSWVGDRYGLLWTEATSNVADILKPDLLRFRTLALDGTPMGDAVPVRPTPQGYGWATSTHLAWNGDEFLAVWNATLEAEWPLIVSSYFMRISAAGIPGAPPRRLPPAERTSKARIVPVGNGAAITWTAPEGIRVGRIACDCGVDADGDGASTCSDCDDDDADTFPYAPDACDGRNTDCADPAWPAFDPATESDDDGDGFAECNGDCDDADSTTYAGAPLICDDRTNNDCNHPLWPNSRHGTEQWDDDADFWSECTGDCNDRLATIHPGALPVCDGLSNNCDDPDWPFLSGNEQDLDGDGLSECGGDNCPFNANPGQEDADMDGFGDACDDCIGACSTSDGQITVEIRADGTIDWDDEAAFSTWNVYRGDISLLCSPNRPGCEVLEMSGWIQAPGSNPLAARTCGLSVSEMDDGFTPAAGEVAFYLVTGESGGHELPLGVAMGWVLDGGADYCSGIYGWACSYIFLEWVRSGTDLCP